MSFLDNYSKVFHPEEPAAKTEVNGEALRNLIREEINNVIGGMTEPKQEPEEKAKPQEPKEKDETPEEDPGESEKEE